MEHMSVSEVLSVIGASIALVALLVWNARKNRKK